MRCLNEGGFDKSGPGDSFWSRSTPAGAAINQSLMTVTPKPARNVTLDLVRLVGMIFVIFIHSPGAEIQSSPVVFFLKKFIADGAVPIFFLLSGYFSALKVSTPSISPGQYARDKFRTLIVPFLFWNLLVLAIALPVKHMAFAAAFRRGGSYLDVNLTLPSILCAVIGIGRYPIVYQFWFLRNLILVAFAAFILVRYLPEIPLLPWFFFFSPVPMGPLVGALNIVPCLGFYLLGHQLHITLPPARFPSCRSSLLYCAAWSLVGAGVIVGKIVLPDAIAQLGSAAFLFMLAIIFTSAPFAPRVAALGPTVMFIYATHEPLQTFIGRVWQAHRWPAFGTLFCFLVIPAIVFPICCATYWILRRLIPRLTLLATGGR